MRIVFFFCGAFFLAGGAIAEGILQREPAREQQPKLAPQPEPARERKAGLASQSESAPITGSVKLSWRAPLTRVNGESLAMGEIDKYIVRYGTVHNIKEMSAEETVEDGQAMAFEIAGLGEGTWYFAMRTIDTNGLGSEWSVSVSKSISR